MTDLLADGLYTLTVVSVDSMHGLDDENVFVLELDGAPKPCCMYAPNSEVGRQRVWGDIVDDWYQLPDAVGRTFIFPIRQVQIGSLVLNQVDAPLVELVPTMTYHELRACRMLLGKFIEYLPTILTGEDMDHELVDATNLTYAFLNSILKSAEADELQRVSDPAR
jgi:hypothetical protein